MLHGTGLTLFTDAVKIVAFKPPHVKVRVEGTMPTATGSQAVTRTIMVACEDLVPLESQERAKLPPLELAYEDHMPRVPHFDFEQNTIACMLATIKACTWRV